MNNGYFTGLTAANQLAITAQVPTHLEICSNMEASKGRTVMVGNRSLRVKRPKMEVTSDNYKILQLLDLIRDAGKWSDLPEQEIVSRLRTRIMEEKLSREELKKVFSFIQAEPRRKSLNGSLSMNLHENRPAIEELVTAAAEELKVDERIVEKDYYVTILLKQLKQRLPDMVFKGGLRNELIVATYIGLLPYPTEMRMVNNYIYQFLQSQKEHELIASISSAAL